MSSDLAAKLAPLRRRFVEELPARIETLRTALAAVPPDLATALRATHSLAGTAGTFGFAELGSAAKKLELSLPSSLAGEGPGEREKTEGETLWQPLLDNLLAQAAAAIAAPRDEAAEEEKKSASAARREPRLALVEDDATLAEHMAGQLARFGYRVARFETPARFFDSLREAPPPDALVMDVIFEAGALAGPEAVLAGRDGPLADTPVVFLSARSDFAARLAAVRAGGRFYLPKPVDLSSLVGILDAATQQESPRPFRILVVDDDALLAEHHCRILDSAGMEARALADPRRVLEALADFDADLVMTDLHMPECSGMELAAVIRQVEAWVSVPIVFLSGETSLDRQMQAMQQGGDDFLTKPVSPEHLVASVRQRAQRHRTLRAYMEHDSLTGLLNHSALKERLAVELARADRNGESLAFAMLDLDHFKKVNDTHGHAAGDRVLRALARLLRERLRRTDIAGRYGGEEFGLILPDTDEEGALLVLEDIRRNFAGVEHAAGGMTFRVTLSAGLAAFPKFVQAEQLAQEADQALYASKHAGRNRVTRAG